MTRLTILTAVTVAALTPVASDATLCRDSKGLFTPCTGERQPAARPHARRGAAHAGADRTSASSTPDAAAADDPKPARPSKPPVVARAKLCRDSKGLFTPCPR